MTPWLAAPPTFEPGVGTQACAYTRLVPAHGAVNVSTTTSIEVCVFAGGGELLPSFDDILVNGESVYDGGGAWAPGYAGSLVTYAGRVFVTITPTAPIPDGVSTQVTVRCLHPNTEVINEVSWSFTTKPAQSYPTSAVVGAETPLGLFLETEPLRLFLMDRILATEVPLLEESRATVAARAIYQAAYSTEISASLAPYQKPDAATLAIPIRARASSLQLAQDLEALAPQYERAVAQLTSRGVLPREYRDNFADYFDSLVYHYRVSAVATLVLLAGAIERAAIEGTLGAVLQLSGDQSLYDLQLSGDLSEFSLGLSGDQE